MEDDDEFGDLYTDVLRPFASSSSLSSTPQPHHSSPAPSSIDLNLNLNVPQIPYAAPHSDSPSPDQITPPDRRESIPSAVDAVIDGGGEDALVEPRLLKEEESADVEGARVLDAEFADGVSTERVAVDDGGEVEAKGVDLVDREVKFDIEDDAGNDIGSEPVIPGLSSDAAAAATGVSLRVDEGGENGGEGDDWDSDSDDDLQIVLNDNNHMAMERGGGLVDDDDEEDEDGGLVIVAGGDPNQGVEEQEWGENTTLPVDGERKDASETVKSAAGGGGLSLVPKSGYGNHGYHPFHSPFKVSVLKGKYLYLGFLYIV